MADGRRTVRFHPEMDDRRRQNMDPPIRSFAFAPRRSRPSSGNGHSNNNNGRGGQNRQMNAPSTRGDNETHPPPSNNPGIIGKGMMTPFSGIIQKYINESNTLAKNKKNKRKVLHLPQQHHRQPAFGTASIASEITRMRHQQQQEEGQEEEDEDYEELDENGNPIFEFGTTEELLQQRLHEQKLKLLELELENAGLKGASTFTKLKFKAKRPFLTLHSKYLYWAHRWDQSKYKQPVQKCLRILFILGMTLLFKYGYKHHKATIVKFMKEKKGVILAKVTGGSSSSSGSGELPTFVFNHPYVTSSYYTATKNIKVLEAMKEFQVDPKIDRLPDRERGIVSRLAILRPFCEFDAYALPVTFACWNSLVPCRAAEMDLGEDDEEEDEWVLFDMSTNGTAGRKLKKSEEDEWECEADYNTDGGSGNATFANPGSWIRGIANKFLKRCKRKPRSRSYFDDVSADGLRTTSADLFLFYSQTFSENQVSITAVDKIMEEFFSPGGWSRCFDNIYAVEANIPPELDLYIPAAQEELYSWVNGPNRQYEAGFRIIQSGEWGDYDGFYLMEGDSVPVKNYWLDVILGEIKAHKPFVVLGAQYDGDKWDAFYEKIPISLLQ